MLRRLLVGMAVVLALLVGAGVYVYNFGTPQAARPAAPPATETSVPAAGSEAAGEAGTEVDPDAVAPEPDPRSPLAIEIPGCKCHSDDPKLVESHADYRMNQCAGCHKGGTPTGQ